MKRAAWILAVAFGLVFLGAAFLSAELTGKSRAALARGVLRDESTLPTARYHVMVLVPDTDDSFFAGILAGIASAAPKAEAAVQVFRYPGSSASDAERYFELALRSGVDGLVMYTPRNDPEKDRSGRAAREGVVLVLVGTDPPPGRTPLFAGSSSLQHGFEGGRLICAELGASARIGVILPSSGTGEPEEDPIYRGIEAATKAFPGSSIEAVARSRPDILSGEEAAALMLRRHPSVNALFCANARDTMGAAQVVVDMNLAGVVHIVGTDETPEILRYIDKGVVSASVVRDSKRIGEAAMEIFSRAKRGEALADTVETGFEVRRPKAGAR
jgi:ribose transport system substrate-binding protein